MVQITEFRIPVPLTTEEYHRGQLYSIAELSKESSGSNGEGVEVIKNEPFEDEMGKGQYTFKVYHVGSSLPSFFSMVLPSKALDVHEESWSAYPYCKTVISCHMLGERFSMTLLSMYKDNDDGNTANIHNLSKDKLAKRKVVKIDIANDEFPSNCTDDVRKFKSTVTGRGPFVGKDWEKQCNPVMWCYKLVMIECKIWGIQTKVESKLTEFERTLFLRLHRRMVCTMDNWVNVSMEQIRAIEDETAKELSSIAKHDKPNRNTTVSPNSPTKLAPGCESEVVAVEV